MFKNLGKLILITLVGLVCFLPHQSSAAKKEKKIFKILLSAPSDNNLTSTLFISGVRESLKKLDDVEVVSDPKEMDCYIGLVVMEVKNGDHVMGYTAAFSFMGEGHLIPDLVLLTAPTLENLVKSTVASISEGDLQPLRK